MSSHMGKNPKQTEIWNQVLSEANNLFIQLTFCKSPDIHVKQHADKEILVVKMTFVPTAKLKRTMRFSINNKCITMNDASFVMNKMADI